MQLVYISSTSQNRRHLANSCLNDGFGNLPGGIETAFGLYTLEKKW